MLAQWLFLVCSLLGGSTGDDTETSWDFYVGIPGGSPVTQMWFLDAESGLKCFAFTTSGSFTIPSGLWPMVQNPEFPAGLEKETVELCKKAHELRWQKLWQDQHELTQLVDGLLQNEEDALKIRQSYERAAIERFGLSFCIKVNALPILRRIKLTQQELAEIEAWEKRFKDSVVEENRKLWLRMFDGIEEVLAKEQKEEIFFLIDVSKELPLPLELLYWQLSVDEETPGLALDLEESEAISQRPGQFQLLGDGKLHPLRARTKARMKAMGPLYNLRAMSSPHYNQFLELTPEQLQQFESEYERHKERINSELSELRENGTSKDRKAAEESVYENTDLTEEVNDFLSRVLIPHQMDRVDTLYNQIGERQVGVLNLLEFGHIGRALKVSEAQKKLLSKLRKNTIKECEAVLRGQSKEFYDDLRKLLKDHEALLDSIPNQEVDNRLPVITLPFLFIQSDSLNHVRW